MSSFFLRLINVEVHNFVHNHTTLFEICDFVPLFSRQTVYREATRSILYILWHYMLCIW